MRESSLYEERVRTVWSDLALTRVQAAKQLGMSVDALRHEARKLDLDMRRGKLRRVKIAPERIEAVWMDPTLDRPTAAARLGVTVAMLTYYAQALELPMRSGGVARHRDVVPSDERVREVWAMEGLTRAEQAREAGIGKEALTDRAQRLDLPMRPTGKKVSAARIREVWLDPELTSQQAADRVGLTRANLWRRAKGLRLPPRKLGHRFIVAEEYRPLLAEMWERHVRAEDIARHFRLARTSLTAYVRRMKLGRRPHHSKHVPLDEFWRGRPEERAACELRRLAQLEAMVFGLASRERLLVSDLRACGSPPEKIARDFRVAPKFVRAVIAKERRSRRIEAALAAALGADALIDRDVAA